MPYEAQQKDIRAMILSPNSQNAYGTVLLDANLTLRPRMDGGIFAVMGKQTRGDGDKANKGHNWPTEFQEILRDFTLNGGLPLTDTMAGFLFAFVMGKDVITGAGPYTHTITFDTVSNIAKTTTALMVDTADIKYKVPDLTIAEIEVGGGPNGEIDASFSMVGSGRYSDVATALPAVPTPTYLLGSDADILIGAQGGAASIKERVRSWRIKVSNGVKVHRAPGNGLYATQNKWGLQRATLQMVVAAKDVDDIRSLWTGNTLREVQININSGAAAQLNMKFPGLYLSAAPAGLDDDEVVWNLEANEDSVIKSGGNEVFQAVVINNQATAYLIGA
jgi:hypothetical protein